MAKLRTAPDLCEIFGLAPSEQSVILGLLRGQSPPEIAKETGRSILTVKWHIKRAYRKIGVRSNAQLFARLLPFLLIWTPHSVGELARQ